MDTLIIEIGNHRVLTFYVVGFLGMLGHYMKKWYKKEYVGNLWAYLIADKPRASLFAVMTYLGTATTVALTGNLASMDINTLITLALTTGYSIDSAINSTAQS